VKIDQLAELVAERLAPLLADQLPVESPRQEVARRPDGLVGIREIARITGMSERWAYDHAREIGGVKTGNTKRARWRFDPDTTLARLAARDDQTVGEGRAPRAPVRELPTDVELLPVKGRAA
jgi:hypothetical protein